MTIFFYCHIQNVFLMYHILKDKREVMTRFMESFTEKKRLGCRGELINQKTFLGFCEIFKRETHDIVLFVIFLKICKCYRVEKNIF